MFFPFHNRGVLGLNARSLLYIKPFNPKKAVAFADDKMKTKAFLSARGIPSAKLFARIDSRHTLRNFDFSSLPDECVLKPNYGFGGEGIMILSGRKNGQFLEQGKRVVTHEELIEHIEDILDGSFSVNGRHDSAFFEQILRPHKCFTPLRPTGLPDIRIIVFNLVPVMAMLRVATAESGGKANVHLGGIGIGIDIAKGVTTHAVQYHKLVKELAHGFPVAGMKIPQWENILLIASKIQNITNIGYLAVDIAIDRDMGPVLLEVNARAGLMVQVANLAPLRARLERVEGLAVSSPEKGVRIAQELFGEKTVRSKEGVQEKKILSTREIIEITTKDFHIHEPCILSPEQEETIFSQELVDELLAASSIELVTGSRDMYKVKFTLGEQKMQTIILARMIEPKNPRVSIGKRDLKNFLIDPSSTVYKAPLTERRKDLHAIDRHLCGIEKELSLLKSLRPLNIAEERHRAKLDPLYNPIFLLPEPPSNLAELEENVKKLDADDSTLGILLKKKRRELLLKIEIIKARGNSERLTSASLALFGSPSAALLGHAREKLSSRTACELPIAATARKTAQEAKKYFEESLHQYGLHDWKVRLKSHMVADCAVGRKSLLIRSEALFTDIHLQSLVAHEIETHILTAENGRMQPYEIFRIGFANYLDTQEGLAIFNQTRVLPPFHEKNYQAAKNVLAVAYALDHSFAETRQYIERELGSTPEKALQKCLDLKRGFRYTKESGAFTKSLVYFRGLRAVEHFLAQGGNISTLFIGKIAIEDINVIKEIPGVVAPLILPMHLRPEPVTAKK